MWRESKQKYSNAIQSTPQYSSLNQAPPLICKIIEFEISPKNGTNWSKKFHKSNYGLLLFFPNIFTQFFPPSFFVLLQNANYANECVHFFHPLLAIMPTYARSKEHKFPLFAISIFANFHPTQPLPPPHIHFSDCFIRVLCVTPNPTSWHIEENANGGKSLKRNSWCRFMCKRISTPLELASSTNSHIK